MGHGIFGARYIEERLDRFFEIKMRETTSSRQQQAATNLVSLGSDHCPVMIGVKER